MIQRSCMNKIFTVYRNIHPHLFTLMMFSFAVHSCCSFKMMASVSQPFMTIQHIRSSLFHNDILNFCVNLPIVAIGLWVFISQNISHYEPGLASFSHSCCVFSRWLQSKHCSILFNAPICNSKIKCVGGTTATSQPSSSWFPVITGFPLTWPLLLNIYVYLFSVSKCFVQSKGESVKV